MGLVRENRLADEIVIVDGIGRSGKMYISNVIASFNRIEKSRLDMAFDIIPKLYNLGELQYDTAITYLRLEADYHLYDNMISRGVNFRKGDTTSVERYPNPKEYIERLNEEEGNKVIERIKRDKPIFQNITHDALANANLFFDAFNRCKFIYCIRNPIDIIYSWQQRGFGKRIGTDPREWQLTSKWKNNIVPIYSHGWENAYLNANEYERVIGMINSHMQNNFKGYTELGENRNKLVCMLDLEKYNKNPMDKCERLAKFLETKISGYTNKMIKNTSTIMINKEKSYKEKIICDNISVEYKEILNDLMEIHEREREMDIL